MTPLEDLLVRTIRTYGPVDVAQFTALALGHPTHGYYAARDPLGRDGDFVTAPEISPLFGELLGLFLVQGWLDRGRPRPFTLVELGPGRGTLLHDALRAARVAPGFLEALRLHLVETSATLREVQARTLAGYRPTAHGDLAGLPDNAPTFLVANEFLDVLPAHQYERRVGHWHERRVGFDDEDRLGLMLDPQPLPIEVAAADGAVLELSPAREAVVAEVAGRLARSGGLALFIDYGDEDEPPLGDTLQAVQGHRKVGIFHEPGRSDLTSHVRFAPLRRVAAAEGAVAWGPIPQGRFLGRLGLELRLEQVARADPAGAAGHRAGADRLTRTDAMGELFRVFACTGDARTPPGFEAEDRWG